MRSSLGDAPTSANGATGPFFVLAAEAEGSPSSYQAMAAAGDCGLSGRKPEIDLIDARRAVLLRAR
jgi:hypothetical protein